MTFSTVYQLVKAHAERTPQNLAILAPGRIPLTYGHLKRQIEDVVAYLNQSGVGRNDRVAIVLPNGPEVAVAFLSIGSGATSAPLNPNYRAPEFEFYLSDLDAKALVVWAEMDSPAIDVARTLGINVIKLVPQPTEPAGIFTLHGDPQPLEASTGFAEPDDIALVLHTSGTTSRPKIVPLKQINICTSAGNVSTTLRLTASDRCMNVMPLFHIHGLIGATLSTFTAGASIYCTPGFDQSRFFEWMQDSQPTWYSAVPTMHQAVLANAASSQGVITRCPLRFIRSSSSSLPPQVMADLEGTFNAPVIESYGMTEASHQMTSNPLPPHQRKAGSVGIPAGPEVAIMDEAGNLLAAEEIGEIVIRGANVMPGYENNPEANASAFTNGWFRTGDQGYKDGDGYFFITGRLKEIINRGGEKIAPREVDEALLDHPAVVQAITFAVPHPTLGEDVVTAVVLRANASVKEKELREFAFAHLADFKVPSQVIFVDEIPKGPTGKLQRIGLAAKLTDVLQPSFVEPRNTVEDTLARLWAEVLSIGRIGVHDNFFALGGDSLLAVRLMARINKTFGSDLPPAALFHAPTIEQLASTLGKIQKREAVSWDSLVAMQPAGSRPPLFFLPGNLGNVHVDLGGLSRYLGQDQPFYGLQDDVWNPVRVKALAKHYLDEIRTVQPEGPYFLGGVCSGGVVAFEMAQQLAAQGEQVPWLALVEPSPPGALTLRAYAALLIWTIRRFLGRSDRLLDDVAVASFDEARRFLRLRLKLVANEFAIYRYHPRPYSGQIDLYLTQESLQPSNPRLGWCELTTGSVRVCEIPGDHNTITGDRTSIEEAHMRVIAEQIRVSMDEILSRTNL